MPSTLAALVRREDGFVDPLLTALGRGCIVYSTNDELLPATREGREGGGHAFSVKDTLQVGGDLDIGPTAGWWPVASSLADTRHITTADVDYEVGISKKPRWFRHVTPLDTSTPGHHKAGEPARLTE